MTNSCGPKYKALTPAIQLEETPFSVQIGQQRNSPDQTGRCLLLLKEGKFFKLITDCIALQPAQQALLRYSKIIVDWITWHVDLDPQKIIYILQQLVDHLSKNPITTEDKFLYAKIAPFVRKFKVEGYGIDEDVTNFRIITGKGDEIISKPQETHSKQDDSPKPKFLTEQMKTILLEYERCVAPKGYKREFVIVEGQLFKVRMGTTKNKPAYEFIYMEEEVPDGTYQFDGYIPRILLMHNKVQVVELLKKIE